MTLQFKQFSDESLLFSWRATRDDTGLFTVRETWPDGCYRLFENVPQSLIEPLVRERRTEVRGRIETIKSYLRERHHLIEGVYDTQLDENPVKST